MAQATTPAPAEPSGPMDSRTRWTIYWLLIVCSVAVMAGRLWQTHKLSYDRPVPFLSANDRSRWCTIRALGDHDTYTLDLVLQAKNGRSWDTIDKVMHWGRDSQPHFYSSKPTLLPTLLTWPYLGIKALTGWNLADNTFDVVRWMLLICQIFPLIIFFWVVGRIGDLVAESDWTRVFLMGCATFGTCITTFAITLNNHVPTVICVSLATLMLIRIWKGDTRHWAAWCLTGLTAALAAAFDLPASSFLAVAFALCLWRNPLYAVTGFVPPVLLVTAGFFATNYTAHHDWTPPYAHRGDGAVLTTISGTFAEPLGQGRLPADLASAVRSVRPDLPPDWQKTIRIVPGQWPDSGTPRTTRWLLYFDSSRPPLVLAHVSGQPETEIRRWNNWYEYPGSYWSSGTGEKSPIDQGEQEPLVYLLNMTFWHHGVFLLSPIWILSLAGIPWLCVSRQYGLRVLGIAILVISVVLVAFYVTRPLEDRNYGGLCCSPRWLFWLAPLWLVAMIPAVDRLQQSVPLRIVAIILLFLSIASASYAWSNPWVHPWLYQWVAGT